MTYSSINGELLSQNNARLNITDLTFRRSYGAFDFLRVASGVPLFIDDYLARFERSAGILGLAYPGHETLTKQLEALLAANHTQNAGVQMFLTGGEPADGYTPTKPNLVLLEVATHPYPEHMFTEGVSLITHAYQRDLAAAKSTNYFMAVYLRDKIRAAGATDALYYSGEHVLETTRCNLFIVKDGTLITPRDNVLHGVTRQQILGLAEGSAPIKECPVLLADLWQADEAFITSSTKGVMPVTRVDDKTISDGKPGEISKALLAQFETHVQTYIRNYQLQTA